MLSQKMIQPIMYMKVNKVHLVALFLLTCFATLWAQPSLEDPDIIEIIHTDRLEVTEKGYKKKLIGNIQLRQAETFFYCDSATIIDKDIFAEGNVVIEQADSIVIKSDQLDYDGVSNKASLIGSVTLEEDKMTLTTHQLNYDLNTRIATYNTGGTLRDSLSKLQSQKGTYYSDTKTAYFSEDVLVTGEDFRLTSDTLQHDLANNISYFHGNTNFQSGINKVTCVDGFYNHQTKYTELYGKPVLSDTVKIAKADTIKYDGLKDLVKLSGNASYSQSKDSFFISGESRKGHRGGTYIHILWHSRKHAKA